MVKRVQWFRHGIIKMNVDIGDIFSNPWYNEAHFSKACESSMNVSTWEGSEALRFCLLWFYSISFPLFTRLPLEGVLRRKLLTSNQPYWKHNTCLTGVFNTNSWLHLCSHTMHRMNAVFTHKQTPAGSLGNAHLILLNSVAVPPCCWHIKGVGRRKRDTRKKRLKDTGWVGQWRGGGPGWGAKTNSRRSRNTAKCIYF